MIKLKKNNKFIFLIGFVLAYYLSILLHEYAQGLMAWIYSLEAHFHSTHKVWFFAYVDKKIMNYGKLLNLGYNKEVAIIAISGFLASLFLFIVSLIVLQVKKIIHYPYIFYFFYWFAIIDLIFVFSYVPINTFSPYGDIGRFIEALSISPWWFIIIGTPIVLLCIWTFFYSIIPRAYLIFSLKKYRSLFLFVTCAVLFWGFFIQGFDTIIDFSDEKLLISFSWLALLIPFVLFIIFYPSHKWIKKKINKLSKFYH